MARAKVVHSADGVEVIFEGDRKNPEPTIGVITFPGGNVEVSRCTDGSYWAHIWVADPASIVDSRVDHTNEAQIEIGRIPYFPRADAVQHVAFRVAVAARGAK